MIAHTLGLYICLTLLEMSSKGLLLVFQTTVNISECIIIQEAKLFAKINST